MTDDLLSSASRAIVACAMTTLVVVAHPTPGLAVDVSCDIDGGDSSGWSVATGGDFNGDGIADIAVGAPCAFASGEKRAGRATVHSGVDGSKLLVVKGTKALQRLGSSVSFIDDLDGDNRDEVIIGSFGWDTTSRTAAGRIDVYDIGGGAVLSVEGDTAGANFGESVLGIADVTGDDIADIVVGAGDDKDGGDKKGKAYLLSGADGSIVDTSIGDYKFDGWGSMLAAPGDIDGDETPDVIVASSLADVPVGGLGSGNPLLEQNNGVVRVLSGASFDDVILEVGGQLDDNLGRAVCPAGTLGFFAGSPAAEPTPESPSKAGVVDLYSWAGDHLMSFAEPLPEAAARFGTAVASPGDLDADLDPDLVAAAPNADVMGMAEAGRVYAMSSADGSVLWSLSGSHPTEKLGQSIAGGPDFDDDGVADAIVGAPGDAPHGRRGAGSVSVVSGADGSEIMRLEGRRGVETRLFIGGWRGGRTAHVRGFNYRGRRRKLRADPYRRLREGGLSVAVLDDSGSPVAGQMKIVVGTGHGADDDTVKVYRADRRRIVISEFAGIGGGYAGGVTVGAGDVLGADGVEEVVVAEADSDDGNVRLKIYQRLDEDPLGRIIWFENRTLDVFDADDTITFQTVEQSIDADGANIAVGNVRNQDANDEIVAGPADGAPAVRVLDRNGNVLDEWLAYFGGQERGTVVATGDLNGDGVHEIITAPATGLPWVKAFSWNGTPFVNSGDASAVSFFAFATSFVGGVQVDVADVDYDGKGEIIVVSGAGMPGTVKAFETDGTPVEGWTDFRPLGPVSKRGLVVAATDNFLRH